MGRKDYLAQQKQRTQDLIDFGERIGIQKMWDYICITLHDPEVMGKDTFGANRLEKVFESMQKLANEYHIAFTTDKEADYYQDLMDRQIKDIFGDKAQSFYERYPEVKKIKYDKTRKGWQ